MSRIKSPLENILPTRKTPLKKYLHRDPGPEIDPVMRYAGKSTLLEGKAAVGSAKAPRPYWITLKSIMSAARSN